MEDSLLFRLAGTFLARFTWAGRFFNRSLPLTLETFFGALVKVELETDRLLGVQAFGCE